MRIIPSGNENLLLMQKPRSPRSDHRSAPLRALHQGRQGVQGSAEPISGTNRRRSKRFFLWLGEKQMGELDGFMVDIYIYIQLDGLVGFKKVNLLA